jgi:hypothetical protein
MKWSRLLAVPLSFILGEPAALACSPPEPVRIKFASNSSTLPAEAASSLKPVIDRAQAYGPKCSSIIVNSYADGGSETPADIRLATERADGIKRALIAAGVGADLIKTWAGAYGERSGAQVDWQGMPGRVRCDPASKNPQYTDGANCQPEYTRCLVFFEDGTFCNYGNFPAADPDRYTVGK